MNLTLREVQGCTGWRRCWISRQIDEGRLIRVESTIISPNGKPEVLIALSSLPPASQRVYLENLSNKLFRAAGYKQDRSLAMLSHDPATLELAIERFKAVREFERLNSIPKTDPMRDRFMDDLVKLHGSIATLYRWQSRWMQSHTLASLIRKSRADTGKPRVFCEEAIAFMMAKFYKTNSRLDAYRATVAEARRYMGEWHVGTYSAACTIIAQRAQQGILIGVQKGARGIADEVVPSIIRELPDTPNLRWSGDHHQCDVFVRNYNKLVRPWITVWLDECTRAIMGYCISLSPSGRTIGLALRHAILQKPDDDTPFHGVPKEVHIDNGSDYISYHMSGNEWRRRHHRVTIELETEGVFRELGIHPIYATAYNAKSKVVERWFGTLEQQFGRVQPGYCSRDSKSKPVGFKDAWNRYSRTLDGWHREWLTWEEFFRRFQAYVRKYNNSVHRSVKMSPAKRWSEARHAGFVPREVQASVLDPLLMCVAKRKVTHQGIRMNGLQGYYRNHGTLLAYIDREVIVRFDPLKLDEIQVYDDAGYICTATYDKPVGYGARQELAHRIADQKRQKKLVKMTIDEALAPLAGERTEIGRVIEDAPAENIERDVQESGDSEFVPIWETP